MTTSNTVTLIISVIIIIVISSSSLSNAGSPAVFILGDSLLDVGTNNFVLQAVGKAKYPHYGIDFFNSTPSGRFSNGLNVADFIARVVFGDSVTSPPAYLSLFHSGKYSEKRLVKALDLSPRRGRWRRWRRPTTGSNPVSLVPRENPAVGINFASSGTAILDVNSAVDLYIIFCPHFTFLSLPPSPPPEPPAAAVHRRPYTTTTTTGNLCFTFQMAASVCSSEEYNNNNISSSSGRCCEEESYTLSADISESESSSGCFSSSSLKSSSFAASHCVSGNDSNFTLPPFTFPLIGGNDDEVMIWDKKKPPKKLPDSELSEIDMMKEKFAKLLLGEDMSGGGKGVCTALSISNAITNLSASVFGELWRLEPLASQKKAMWQREMDWLLSVSDSIVDFVPSIQQSPDGGSYEVMATCPRADLALNLPALKKLDSMLITMLDGFCNTEFWYVDRGIVVAEGDSCEGFPTHICNGRPSIRQEEKWWLPYPKLPPNGLSEDARKRLQQCRDCTNQILKAALAINSNVLAEMEIPNAYLESLPKSGKACLGDIIYRYITAEKFSAEHLLDCLDLSSEHHTLEVVNRVEGAIYAWKLKDNHSKTKHSSWSEKVKGLVIDGDKNAYLAQRAETLLHSLRLRFPGLPQTSLDMTKIQYNKDVGQSILESYSRVLESLAFNITARIDDVMFVDDATKHSESLSTFNRGGLGGRPIQKRMSPSPFSIQHTPYSSPFATPAFSTSPILIRSPARAPINDDNCSNDKVDILKPADLERVWK
ncbi:hypothetical protein SSX86_009420 [Deinandra increscens subsp. villosa]|uniref:PRONE domain-containing protein n=1 Tax=Deinandra increscens subsp. villosa TaxID=3103831 RepID=A0AAP0DDK5_9ASTR